MVLPLKQNPMIAKIEAKYKSEYKAKFERQMEMAMQLICDASFLASNRMFHMGPARAPEYRKIQEEELKWIIELIRADQEDDPDFEYAKAKVDERLKQICGENFQPWSERYGATSE